VIYGLGLEGTEYLSEFLKKNPVSKLDEIRYSAIYPGKHLSLWWEVDREKRRLEKINLLKNSTTESVDEVLSK
jgi:hypothetical protein